MNQKEWLNNLYKIFRKYNIDKPKNISLYKEAFTHTSYANDNGLRYNYERLEFLGDSAIQWVIVNYLYRTHKILNEGEMSIIKGNLVKKDTLIEQAKIMGLDKLIFLGNSIQKDNIPPSILEDVYESFIGALSQDHGIRSVGQLIYKTIINSYQSKKINIEKDEKTKLQEIVQTSKDRRLSYEHVKIQKKWRTNLYLVFDNYDEKVLLSTGFGDSTSESDKDAARQAIEKNTISNHNDIKFKKIK